MFIRRTRVLFGYGKKGSFLEVDGRVELLREVEFVER